LDFPLTTFIGIAGRENEETYTPKSYKAKLEQLCSARLTRHDQTVTLLDMQKASSDKDFLSLLQLTLNNFKQVLAIFM
jgi:hypothetical protein